MQPEDGMPDSLKPKLSVTSDSQLRPAAAKPVVLLGPAFGSSFQSRASRLASTMAAGIRKGNTRLTSKLHLQYFFGIVARLSPLS